MPGETIRQQRATITAFQAVKTPSRHVILRVAEDLGIALATGAIGHRI